MTYVLKYHLRLGDIICCFPAARYLKNLGHTVLISCNPEYHSIFECINYAKPILPNVNVGKKAKILDLQIWPDKFSEFRKSGKKWMDFVYSNCNDIKDADRKIVFDTVKPSPIKEKYDLVAPFGISQATKLNAEKVIDKARELFQDDKKLYVLVPSKEELKTELKTITANKLSELPGIIRDADKFLTINSSPNIIASAVRKCWCRIQEPSNNFQDDFGHENSIIVSLQI